MKYALLLILLFPYLVQAQKRLLAADTCVSITFKETISSPGYIQINRIKQLPDGEYIITGLRNSSSTSTVLKGFIGKLSGSGDLVWSKTLGYDSDGYESEFSNSILTSDNNIFVIAGSGNYPGENHLIIKFDYDGNIIWKYKYDFESGGIGPIRPTDDGGIYFSGSNSNNGIFVGKINSAGTLQWAQYYGAGSGYMNAQNFTESGNSLYIVGTGLINGNRGTTTYIAKVNKISGDLAWAITYGSVVTNDYDVSFTDVQPVNGYLLVTGSTSRFSSPGISPALFTLDTSGTCLGAVCYLMPGQNTLSDNPFIYNDRLKLGAYTPSVDSNDIIFFKPGNTGLKTLRWASPGNQVLHDMSNCADSGSIVSLLSIGYAMPADWTKALIIKNNNQVIDSNCNYQTVNCNTTNFIVSGETLPLTTNALAFNNTSSDIHEITAGQLTVEKICSSLRTCSLGQLTGVDSLCAGQTAIYQTNTYGDCGNAIFSIDTSFAQIVTSSTNQVTLHFNRPGTVQLFESLTTGCGTQKDSSAIHIFPTSVLLNLGPDTSICPNNTLPLKAGPGYMTYLWQDGSTDSLFDVHSAGTYYVSVTDFCGNTSSDTIRISAAAPVPFDLGPDLTKCNADSLTITAPPGFLQYHWYPAYNISASTGQSVIVFPETDTLYKVSAEKTPGCFAYDSIHVHVNHSPVINLGTDTSFCSGDSLLLNAGSGFVSYQWNTGANSQFITVHNAGYYRVTATAANGCSSHDTIQVVHVYSKPVVNLTKDSSLCEGAGQLLSPGPDFPTYMWSTGSNAPAISVSMPGTYWVAITDNNGCNGSDTARIKAILPSPAAFLPADTSLCNYLNLQIKPLSQFSSYLWNTGATTNTITISQAGNYWLQVTDDNNCTGRDTIIISPRQCLEGFFIPNAFTPNKDGKNDLFYPLLVGHVISYRFTVFNRWGQKVFETTELQKGWDGSIAGNKMGTNAFVWICTYQLEGQPAETKKGVAVLLR